ncbi:Hypothetical protein Y17_4037 [Pectobacterium wasabiae CFBP 3304]|nr:Hypothetical protein Y17_4037 [Pectobacterium wasabiae CFBP 3304]
MGVNRQLNKNTPYPNFFGQEIIVSIPLLHLPGNTLKFN